MTAQPTGTVTLLFSDVEASTRLLERLGTARYREVLELHRTLLREAFVRHRGYEVGTEGDSFFVAFAQAEDAVAAADEAQRSLADAAWPEDTAVRVRMGVHTGEPVAASGNYVGMDVHRAARIVAAGHGGQVLVSETTAALLDGVALRDLGPQRLKDLLEPIRLYQLEINGVPGEFPPLRSLHQTNLPVPLTPFLGREEELRELGRMVADEQTRVVTVTGPGGVGKTRLALQAAAESADAFPDGVFWVALAPVRDSSLLPATVAQALEVREQPDRTVAESVIAELAEKRALLLLDNCEHLLEAVANLVRQLVERSPHLVVVCSSRERLGLRSERVFPVPPMTVSDGKTLFAERARAVAPDFVADEHVPAICAALDELPLAIELAAARVRSLSTFAIRERLAERLPLLASRDRDRDERQRTLEATIAWSYDLLDSDEQRALRALSVFAGGGTLEAVEFVAGADLDLLESLLDKSLVRHRPGESGPDRYWLLETIREYAAARLEESGEGDVLRQRHRDYFVQRAASLAGDRLLVEAAEVSLFDADRANYRVVLLDALADGDADTAISLVAALAGFWLAEGEIADSYGLTRAALELPGGSERDRGWALRFAAQLVTELSDFDESTRLLADAEENARSRDDQALLSAVFRSRSLLRGRLGDYEDAARWARLATEAIPEDAAENVKVEANANQLQMLRLAASDRDDPDRTALEHCLKLGEELLERAGGNPLTEGRIRGDLALICLALSRPEDALSHSQRDLRLRRQFQSLRSRFALYAIQTVALAAGRLGDHVAAVRLSTAWRRAFGSEGLELDQEDVRLVTRLEADAGKALDPDSYQAAVNAGAALTVEEAAELALSIGRSEDSVHGQEQAVTARG